MGAEENGSNRWLLQTFKDKGVDLLYDVRMPFSIGSAHNYP